MASSIYFGRTNGFVEKHGNGLPTYSSSSAAIREKRHRQQLSTPWLTTLSLPIPGVRTRRLRLLAPNIARLHQSTVARFGRRRGTLLLLLGFLSAFYFVFAIHKRFGTDERSWPTPISLGEPSSLVYRREDLQRIWEWEVAAGHYPSSRKLPEQLGFSSPPHNPSLPPRRAVTLPSRFRGPVVTDTTPAGPKRVYLDLVKQPPNVAYPPRPVPGSVADMDVIMDNCDFSTGKYVRDCLEVLRLGGGLELGARVRRAKMDDWKYIYMEDSANSTTVDAAGHVKPAFALKTQGEVDYSRDLPKKRGAEWEPHVRLPAPPKYVPYKDRPTPCDDENPRIYHMFWAGPFTDKPYLALLSFLFTQNLELHKDEPDSSICRPKFWMWINPGPAASIPNPSAVRDMFDSLKLNPWASPFLHPRFKDVIQFKLWNTTEQLDNVPELKDEWRAYRGSLFNSGGVVEKVEVEDEEEVVETTEAVEEEDGDNIAAAAPSPTKAPARDEDDKVSRVGSKSASSYDRMSVILSDMVRFILTHRFGGIYLDADTILLRDWEELWGWRGAFAYRWSRLEKYNTAVLKMNKGSALGSFLFRTALANKLDFHPMSVSKYTKEAYVEGLLLRLPDALFDAAWLNTESYQRDRPPQPYFQEFGDFFETPGHSSAQPMALGFDGFFKGSYSYHFHNFWWRPFDPWRNFPDLGPRFAAGERLARASLKSTATATATAGTDGQEESTEDRLEDDKRDLDWATVLKRTFESYVRGERPNMYGEWLKW